MKKKYSSADMNAAIAISLLFDCPQKTDKTIELAETLCKWRKRKLKIYKCIDRNVDFYCGLFP